MEIRQKRIPLSQLTPFHKNPRLGDVEALAESLRMNGQFRPIVVNVGTLTGRPFEILAGNHTARAAEQLGWDSLECSLLDVDDEKANRIVLADNKIAQLGGFDEALLLELLESLDSPAGSGFSVNEVDAFALTFRPPVALTNPDDVPQLSETTVSMLGDVWVLGDHVLLVGDCTDVSRVSAAAPGEADAVWTDPPYGVDYMGKTTEKLTIKNDGRAAALDVTIRSIPAMKAVCRPGAAVFMAHADSLRVELQTGMEAEGFSWRQTLIWAKNQIVMGHSDFHFQHETVAFGEFNHEQFAWGFLPGGNGRLGRGGKFWFGDNKQSTVFNVPKPARNRDHPTMKPVELIERMLANVVRAGGLVFDPFGGSGSTLIAAHRLGARAFLVELDPRFADAICRRFEEHTGVVPVRDGVAVSFLGGVSHVES